jgi:hypothetical protein
MVKMASANVVSQNATILRFAKHPTTTRRRIRRCTSLHEVIRFRHARQVASLIGRLRVAAGGLPLHDTTGPCITCNPVGTLPTAQGGVCGPGESTRDPTRGRSRSGLLSNSETAIHELNLQERLASNRQERRQRAEVLN